MRLAKGPDHAFSEFFCSVVFATPREMLWVLGSGNIDTYEWSCQTEAGAFVKIYVQPKTPVDGLDEESCFHIAGFSRRDTELARREILTMLPGHDHAITEEGIFFEKMNAVLATAMGPRW